MISLKNTLKAISSKFTALNTLLNDVPHYTLLWTNPNPTSSFSAQTISLDLSKYDAVEIVHKKTANEPWYLSNRSPYIQSQGGALNYIDDDGVVFCRQYKLYASSISFDGGRYKIASKTSDDTRCIPYKIYGIKFGGGGV